MSYLPIDAAKALLDKCLVFGANLSYFQETEMELKESKDMNQVSEIVFTSSLN